MVTQPKETPSIPFPGRYQMGSGGSVDRWSLLSPEKSTGELQLYSSGKTVQLTGLDKSFPVRNSVAYRSTDEEVGTTVVVCDPDLPPQISLLGYMKMRGITMSALCMPRLDFTYVESTHRVHPVMLYNLGGGEPLANRLLFATGQLDPTVARKQLMGTLTSILHVFSRYGITHQGISPWTVISHLGSGKGQSAAEFQLLLPVHEMVGALTPMSYHRIGDSYTPFERSGVLDIGADIYHLGVLLYNAVTGTLPASGTSAEENIRSHRWQKIRLGTFVHLSESNTGQAIPSEMLVPLRGMTADDFANQWDLDTIHNWIDGSVMVGSRRYDSDQHRVGFQLLGGRHFSSKAVTHLAEEQPQQVFQPAALRSFLSWIRKRTDIERLQVEGIIGHTALLERGRHNNYTDKLLAVADETAPMFAEGFAMTPNSLPAMLVIAIHRPQLLSMLLAACFSRHLPELADRRPQSNEAQRVIRTISAIRVDFPKSMNKEVQQYIYMYLLASDLSCQSSMLRGEFVLKISKLFPALERSAAENKFSYEAALDPAFLGFLASRSDSINLELLQSVLTSEQEIAIGKNNSIDGLWPRMIKLLSSQQELYYPKPMPHLCRAMFAPVKERLAGIFLDPESKRTMVQLLEAAVKRGNLGVFYRILTNNEAIVKDRTGFQGESKKYHQLVQTHANLLDEKKKMTEWASNFGHEISAAVTLVLALMISMGAVLFG